MRKKLIAVLTLSLFLFSASMAMAAVPAIFVNGNGLTSESPAVVEDGRTLLPLRAVFESLNQEVTWNGDDKFITSGNIWLQIDNPVATVDGEDVNLDVAAKIVDGVTYVPLRFVAESLGKDVVWDGVQNRVDINDKPVIEEEVDEEAPAEDEAVVEDDAATDDEAVVDDEAADEETEEDEDAAVTDDESADEETVEEE